jgi:hypothetical protein
LIVENVQIVRSEHVTAKIDRGSETSKKQIVDSLPVPVPPKKTMKIREERDEMVEKSFTILTSSAATAASADDYEWRSFRSFISNELRNYLPPRGTKCCTK